MDVFLSASVPLPTRDERFYETADVIAIRDAVKALATTVLPNGRLVFGGHPAITPLLSLVIREMFPEKAGSVILYQSKYFEGKFPKENNDFIDIRLVDGVNDDRDQSLLSMRQKMFSDFDYQAAVFIGGMEGVIDEYELFQQLQPNTPAYPIASTGGAALELFQSGVGGKQELLRQLTYPTLFRHLLQGTLH